MQESPRTMSVSTTHMHIRMHHTKSIHTWSMLASNMHASHQHTSLLLICLCYQQLQTQGNCRHCKSLATICHQPRGATPLPTSHVLCDELACLLTGWGAIGKCGFGCFFFFVFFLIIYLLLLRPKTSIGHSLTVHYRGFSISCERQARSQGGFGGCGRTPFFSDQKKKSMVSAFGSCVFRVPSRLHVPS